MKKKRVIDECIGSKCYSWYRCKARAGKECDQDQMHKQGAIDCKYSNQERFSLCFMK